MKRSFTRIFCTLLSCLLLVGLLAGGVVAMAEDAATGQCGQNLTWRYDPETGVLTIEGEGNMWDYDSIKLMPWFQYAGNIKKIVLSNGVTSIGKNAFACCAVEEVEFPETLKTIGEKAFYECEKLTKVDLSKTQLTTVAQKAFAGCKELKAEEVKLPETAKSVAANAFEKAVVKPVQAPAPVQTPVEAPQEPAVSNTWEENFPDGSKLVLTRQADGTVAVVSYLKDGSVEYRSVRTYGADGKVHEEFKFTDGIFLVEDRIEDKDGNPLSGTYLEYDENNKLTHKTIFKTEGNVTVDTEVDLEDERVVLNETTTTLHDDGSYTEDFVGYNNGKVRATRNGHYDKNNQLIKETYTQTSGDEITSIKIEGTRVPGKNGTVIDTYKTTITDNAAFGPLGETVSSTSYHYATVTVDSAGHVIFEEMEYRNEKDEVIHKYKEATKYNEDGSSVSTHTTLGNDGKITSTSESAYDKNHNWLKSTAIYYDAKDSNGRPCIQTTITEKDGDNRNITTKRAFEDGSTEESKAVQRENGLLVSRDTVITNSEGKKTSTIVEKFNNYGGLTEKTETNTATGDYSVTTYKPDGTNETKYYSKDGSLKQQDENANNEVASLEELEEEKSVDDGFLLEDRDLDDEISDGMDTEEGTPVVDGSDEVLPDENLDHDDEISDGMDTEEGTPVVDSSDEVIPDEDLDHDDEISDGMDSEEGAPVVNGTDKVNPDEDQDHDDEISDGMDSEEGAPVVDGTDKKAPDAVNTDAKTPSTESTGKEKPSAGDSTTQVTPAPAASTQAAPAPAASTQPGAATTQVTSSQKESDKKDADKKKDKKKNKKQNGEEDLLDEETTTEAPAEENENA